MRRLSSRSPSKFIVDHHEGKLLRLCVRMALSSVLYGFDTIRDLNHEIFLRKFWILGANFGHSFVGRSLYFLLMTLLDIFV